MSITNTEIIMPNHQTDTSIYLVTWMEIIKLDNSLIYIYLRLISEHLIVLIIR